MEAFGLAAAAALIQKVVDFVKLVSVRDKDAIVAQLETWLAGFGVIWLLAQANFAERTNIGSQDLGEINMAGLVLLGLTGGSVASVLYDFKRAVDRTDSAAMPAIVTGNIPLVPPAVVDTDAPGVEVSDGHVTTKRSRARSAAGYGLVGLLAYVAALVLCGVGLIAIFIAATARHEHVSTGGVVMVILGLVVAFVARALDRDNGRTSL
jgi:hypothetical protein